MITNLVLTLFVSTNVTLHWEPSPDTSVVSYTLYASPLSRFTNQWIPAESTPPQVGSNPSPTVVRSKSVCIGTNADWIASATKVAVVDGTNWIIPPQLDSVRSFYSVTALAPPIGPSPLTFVESDLSNEVLLNPRWLWVTFAIEASHDLTNWAVIGRTNLWRVWRPEGASFFRGRLIIAP